jgi:hypothetical protein
MKKVPARLVLQIQGEETDDNEHPTCSWRMAITTVRELNEIIIDSSLEFDSADEAIEDATEWSRLLNIKIDGPHNGEATQRALDRRSSRRRGF